MPQICLYGFEHITKAVYNFILILNNFCITIFHTILIFSLMFSIESLIESCNRIYAAFQLAS